MPVITSPYQLYDSEEYFVLNFELFSIANSCFCDSVCNTNKTN